MEAELYQKFYDVETSHWWFSARRKIIYYVIRNILKLKEKSAVLDFGCGTGGVLDILTDEYTTYGADTSELAIDFCKQRNLQNIISIQELQKEKKYENMFDLITVLDVIEHIDDDVSALKDIYPLLKKNGCLFITVPAYQFLYGPYDVLTQHKRRYIKKNLEKVVTLAGFEVVRTSYFNTFLSPLMIIARLIKAKTGSHNDTDIPVKPVNVILRNIFNFEKFCLKFLSFPFGISIMCIARKK